MNELKLTQKQCEAVADILVLAMCIDGHFSLIEDEKIISKIASLGWDTDLSPDHHLNLSIAKARDAAESLDKTRMYVEKRAEVLDDPEIKKLAFEKVVNLLNSDGLKNEEGTFIMQLRAILKV